MAQIGHINRRRSQIILVGIDRYQTMGDVRIRGSGWLYKDLYTLGGMRLGARAMLPWLQGGTDDGERSISIVCLLREIIPR